VRVLVVGGSGVIGRFLVPLLRQDGHLVAATTRTADKLAELRAWGAEAVQLDAYQAEAVRDLVRGWRPEAVIDLLTDLPDDPRLLAARAEGNNRLRLVGTAHVVQACREAAVPRLLAESVAWPLTGEAEAAVVRREALVLAAGGSVLRYGRLYGPGTYYPDGSAPRPRVGLRQAAEATRAALDWPPATVGVVSSAEDQEFGREPKDGEE